jgi:hypothetical protein
MVAKELRGGRMWPLFRGEFRPEPPFPVGPETLMLLASTTPTAALPNCQPDGT